MACCLMMFVGECGISTHKIVPLLKGKCLAIFFNTSLVYSNIIDEEKESFAKYIGRMHLGVN